MSENKTAEEAIELIKGRIMDEYRKHQTLDWSNIAARKIHSQWFEYYNQQNQELQRQVDGLQNNLDAMDSYNKQWQSQYTQLKDAADENKQNLIEACEYFGSAVDKDMTEKEMEKYLVTIANLLNKALTNYKQLTQNQNG